jgi:hypothetical protein
MQHIPPDIVYLSIVYYAPRAISLAIRARYPTVLKAQSSQAISIAAGFNVELRWGDFAAESWLGHWHARRAARDDSPKTRISRSWCRRGAAQVW